jgi:hypothetical protein
MSKSTPIISYNGSAVRISNPRKACLVALDSSGHILRASGVKCVWSGSRRFDAWFRALFPCTIYKDGGERARKAAGEMEEIAA